MPSKNTFSIVAALFLLGMASSPSTAQNRRQQDASPKPAARLYLPFINDSNQDEQNSQDTLTPDQSSLTGAELPTLGSPEMRHSYWVPGISFQNVFRSPANGTGNWVSSSYTNGNLSVSLASLHSQLRIDYTGGAFLTHSTTLPISYIHELSLFETVRLGRWQLLFTDQFQYLPQNSFGFGGVSGISVPGVGGSLGTGFPGLQAGYSPNQSLFSTNGTRITNSPVAQAEYALTPRASLTAVASYGILSFEQPRATDTYDTVFSLGYNYRLSRADTLGLLYRFTGYRYGGNPQALNDHSANLAYGRKITGRLALQFFGGPEVRTYRQSILGSTDKVSFSGGGLLTYAFARSNLSLSYSRGFSGGSGILIGSVLDSVDARWSYQLTRVWQASAMARYSSNGTVAGTPVSTGSRNINSLSTSGGISRPVGRDANFSLNYTFDYQNLSQPLCPLGGCAQSYSQHLVWTGFQWHTRPFVIR